MSGPPARVLHVSHDATPGGSNEVMLSLIRHAPAGTESGVVFLKPGPVQARAAELAASTETIDAGRAREVWKAPGVVRALRRVIRERRPEVVFAHVTKAHLYASIAARREGVPYLWWQQERRSQKPVMHEVAGRLPAAAVVCSAEWTAAEQRRRWPRTPVHRIWLGIETDGADLARPHTAGAGDELVLGIVGRLQRWKRVELALRAMPAVLAQEPRARLRVAGDAAPGLDEDYPAALHAEAQALGIAHAVGFLGHVDQGSRLMGELDVLVHTAEDEPFGLVVVEAMLRGVPVVAPGSGGPAEIVRDGVDGLLVDVEDAPTLAQAIVALARDPGRRAQMGASGRERALTEFTAERMAAQAWELMAAVAQG